MFLSFKDLSNRSRNPNWRPPHLFSRVERFDFTNHREKLAVRILPTGPRGFQVVEIVSSGHESLTTEFQKSTVIFPISGTFISEFEGRKLTAVPGEAVAFGPVRRKATVVPDARGNYRSLSIISPAPSSKGEERDDLCKALPGGDWAHRKDYGKLNSIVEFNDYIYHDISNDKSILNSKRTFAAVETIISEYFHDVIESNAHDIFENSADTTSVINLAREFMVEHFGEDISVGDIANACNVSVRSLQLAFRTTISMSPREALTAIRMERARVFLERGGQNTSVTSAAHNAGFFHLGRFSRSYFATYGEKPSETLKRRLN